ncbi:MerR family DNA-binding transcriptional regulator [Clostridium beijerinckii]|uniref:helix-turn-helix domain-containing protein n=1 Tax=Clostridium beijerinckii TaxID=1520 RepID=UPI003B58AEDC
MKYYCIGELAHLARVSTRTVDYYAKIGVIKEKERTSGNHRLYIEESLIWFYLVNIYIMKEIILLNCLFSRKNYIA